MGYVIDTCSSCGRYIQCCEDCGCCRVCCECTESDFDKDELGIDPEEEYDATA